MGSPYRSAAEVEPIPPPVVEREPELDFVPPIAVAAPEPTWFEQRISPGARLLLLLLAVCSFLVVHGLGR